MGLVRTQTNYTTAMVVPVPRVVKTVLARAIAEAELAGEDFEYFWTQKGGEIRGLSIEGAMILYRNWQNCALPTEVVVDAPEHWLLRATFIDLETGTSVERLFRQRKGQTTSSKMDADRAQDIAFAIGQSKVQRNAIDKAMPVWLKNATCEAARKSAAAKLGDLGKAIDDVLTKYTSASKGRITLEMLERKFGVVRAMWTPPLVVQIKQLYKSLIDRVTSIETEFPPVAPVPDVAPAAATPAAPATPEPTMEGPAPAASAPVAPPPAAPKSEPKPIEREPGID